jgi:uncharacterized protein (DUF952 family)
MKLIYHITTSDWWNKNSSLNEYASETLNQEGFIHCSTKNQVAGVLKRYYSNQTGLVLLNIDPTKLTAELKFELATFGQSFPHVYGSINKDAIVKIEEIPNN